MIEQQEPSYITIVEGPPPEFMEVKNQWALGVLEGPQFGDVAMCEMRTLNGPQLVDRCHNAWREGRPAVFDFPIGDGDRAELDIVGARWEEVPEGHKLFLWLKV